MKKVTGLVILISFIGALFIFYSIHDSTSQSQKIEETTTPTQTNGAKIDDSKEVTPSIFGRVFIFFVLISILVVIIVTTYKSNRGTSATVPWGDILLQPVFIAIIGVIVLNSFANLFAYPNWRWFWDHQTLFWGTNMALVILAHFAVKKELYAKIVACGVAILIIIGFTNTDNKSSGSFFEEYKQKMAIEKAIKKAFAQEPVLAVVAKCRPREFDSPEKVEKAEKLYQEQGLLPWQDSMSCWESMIPWDILPIKLAVVEAPIGSDLSKTIKNPRMEKGVMIDWPEALATCEIVPNGDESKKLPCQKANFTEPLVFFQFRSTGPKPEKVEVVVRQ